MKLIQNGHFGFDGLEVELINIASFLQVFVPIELGSQRVLLPSIYCIWGPFAAVSWLMSSPVYDIHQTLQLLYGLGAGRRLALTTLAVLEALVSGVSVRLKRWQTYQILLRF